MINLNSLRYVGKYLDQPSLVNKFHKNVPYALTSAALGYGLLDTYNAPKEKQKSKFISNLCVLSFTVTLALLATRGLKLKDKKIFEGLIELPHLHNKDIDEALKIVTDEKTRSLILKVKDGNILKLNQVKELAQALEFKYKDKNLIDNIIPKPHNHKPFEELKNLSILGLIPVLGGVMGGILGEKLTNKEWKKTVPNKIKEGSYQYLNNIFLCNVGAGLALLLMNKLNVKSKPIRFVSMLSGVVGVGLIAGSAIANYIGKKFINPIFDRNHSNIKQVPITLKNLNSERHPELVDLSLHMDDLASVGFLTGLKWIGPILPVMYSVSGYRTGIGYRNNNK